MAANNENAKILKEKCPENFRKSPEIRARLPPRLMSRPIWAKKKWDLLKENERINISWIYSSKYRQNVITISSKLHGNIINISSNFHHPCDTYMIWRGYLGAHMGRLNNRGAQKWDFFLCVFSLPKITYKFNSVSHLYDLRRLSGGSYGTGQ